MTAEIGYGNAAGFLFHKGITNPPSASVKEIPDDEAKPFAPSTQATQSTQPAHTTDRDPITALRERMTALANANGQQEQEPEMTDDEKEREAERLYTLFKRLEKNPVLSMQSGTGQGQGAGEAQPQSIDQLMRSKLESGDLDRIERQAQEAEKRQQEERDKEDEKQAIREQKKLRMARGIKDWEERHGRCWDTASISDIDDVRWFDHDDDLAKIGDLVKAGVQEGKGKGMNADADASASVERNVNMTD
jgi:hypothetical protein